MILLLCLSALNCLATEAHPLDVWHWRNPLPQGNPLNAVVYGNGLYVAVGEAGTVLTSTTGTNWVRQASGTLDDLYSVTHGEGQFVAVGRFGAIVTSADGMVWTPQYGGTFFSLYSVSFGNGVYVAVGEKNTIVSSVDGLVWISRSSGPFHLTGIAFGNNTFVAVGGVILTSNDGLNWFRRPAGESAASVAYGDGRFVVGSYDYPSPIWTSVDGIAWRSVTTLQINETRTVAYGGGAWLISSGDYYAGSIILRSLDATNWVAVHTNQASVRGFAFGAGKFLAATAGGAVLLSSDGNAWSDPLGPALHIPYGWRDLTYADGKFALVGLDVIAFSPDGVIWTNAVVVTNLAEFVHFRSIAYGNGLYVAGGDYRTLWVSTNGLTWTNPAPELELRPYVSEVNDIIYENGRFVAVSGYEGSILTSTDGLAWSVQNIATNGSDYLYLRGVAYGNGMYVVVGEDRVAVSTNGDDWSAQSLGEDIFLRGVAYGNGRFVAVGASPIVVSTDGTNWVRTASNRYLHQVAFGAGYFVAVGGEGDFGASENPVWTSEDGVDWTPRHAFTREALLAISYGNGTFVMAGSNGGILQSDPLVTLNLGMSPAPHLTLSGPVNRSYQIECAPQPGAWQPLKIVFADSMPFSVTDTTATNQTRFYRALLQP